MRFDSLFASSLLFGVAMAATAAPEVTREETPARVTENIPAIPPPLLEQLTRYQNTRGATLAGWTRDGCLLIQTRFAETAQAHRVCQPLGMREQLTFYAQPIGDVTTAPAGAKLDGFVFSKDSGGDEFAQLYWFDFATREVSALTQTQRAQNHTPVFSRDGNYLAWGSTARNGTDTDVWLMDMTTRKSKILVAEGGAWNATNFSPDGKHLLVMKTVSVAEAYPGEVDLDSGKLTLFPVDGGKAAFSNFQFTADGRGVYFVSDEPLDGKSQEFRTLRFHDIASKSFVPVSRTIAWDVGDVQLSQDGKRLAFMTNEDGIGTLHVLDLPDRSAVKLPEIPVGVIGGMEFSPDGQRLALTINSATSPNDVYVIDFAPATLTRWTRSEVGGLDAAKFVAPTLVRYPTFDKVGGKARTIPAFYYRPANLPQGKKIPVLIRIHGGPESQALPVFNASVQQMVNEMGMAVLVPNVRGSTGYGKSYAHLDDGAKREDSVRDIGALLDWIGKQPELDAQRVAVFGSSYGGYMVLAALTHYSDRLRAGVEAFGISDFLTFLEHTESYRRDLRRAEYGDERDPAMHAVFERISPMKNVAKIKVPLFVAQGRNDPRVAWTESEQIVKAVRAGGTPVWYVLFADEGHGFNKKDDNDYVGAATALFLQRYLGETAPP